MKLAWIFGSLAVSFSLFCITDCSAGKTKSHETYVAEHVYHPAWAETTIHTDAKGQTSVYTTYHPEEYHLLCPEYGIDYCFDIEVSRNTYSIITNGQYETIRSRQGKWTGWHYINSIK